MRIGQRQAPHHFQRLQHVRFRFSGEPHQDIRPKPETGPQLSYALHSRKQRLRRIMPTAHGLQHVRAPALERQVQVRADHAGFGKRGDAPFRKLRGFHGTDAETRRIGPGAAPPLRSQFSVQIGQQIPKIPAPLVTHGVLAQVDAGNHDLAVARLKQAAHFGKAILRRAAPGRAARQGDNAIGAPVRAAVLHLEYGTGPAESVDMEGRERTVARGGAGGGFGGGGRERRCASRRLLGEEDERRRVEQAGFMILLHNAEHAGQGGKLLAGHFGGAPGDNDGHAGRFALEAAYGLPCVGHGIGGDGARIEQDHVRLGGRVRLRTVHALPCLAH